MNPVSATKATAGTDPASSIGPSPPASLPVAMAGVSFGRLLSDAAAGGLAIAHAPTLHPLARGVPSAPLRSSKATSATAIDVRDERSTHASRRSSRSLDSFDHLPRHLASPSDLAAWLSCATSPPGTLAAGASDVAVRAGASLEKLLPALVRRVAWSSDGKRGTARLEIGSGDLAGATLLVHADAGRIRVRLDAPPGVDVHSWRERIVQRLAARDIPVDEVEVS
jgi:hypothetical protein